MAQAEDKLLSNNTLNNLDDSDFVAWANQQVLFLEQKHWSKLDLINLIEEVRDLGNRYQNALLSQLIRLLAGSIYL